MTEKRNEDTNQKEMAPAALRPGDKLSRPVISPDGGELFPADTILLSEDITLIRLKQVPAVTVYDAAREVMANKWTFERKALAFDDEEAFPRASQLDPETAARRAAFKIMVVDDITIIRKHIRTILERHGYFLAAEADDGDEAVRLAVEIKPDVILMDYVMKRMDGITALREIKRLLPDTCVIIMTQSAKPSIVRESMVSGAANFIIKPFTPRQILSILKKVLAE